VRQLHPRTLEILANNDEYPAYPISHCWSEVFKWLGSRQNHPKVFIIKEYDLGVYLAYIYNMNALKNRCLLDKNKINNLSTKLQLGFKNYYGINGGYVPGLFSVYFNDNHLFSDVCSLYYKGINIFPEIFGDDWKQYCPVISHKEIIRQCEKAVGREG
jgi:hypothetical protein